jgi:choline-glycine betaine transporter
MVYIIIKYGYNNMKHGRSAIKIDSSTPARSSLVATIAFSPILVAISGPTKGVDARSQHANVFLLLLLGFFLLSSRASLSSSDYLAKETETF